MAGQLGTVVVGGGTGFIGTALCNSLRHRGYDVLAVSRKPGPYRITWSDFSNKGLPDSTTAVVSLAGQNVLDPVRRWTEGFKQNVWASRVNTTKYLAEAIQHSSTKPKVFVSASGVGVVLGRQGGMVQQLILPFYMGFGGPVGSGNQSMPWIHIQDIVGLFIHAIEKENVIGIVNGVAPQIITNREFATAFGKALRRPSFVPLPTFAVNLLFNEERGKIMTEGQKVTPKKALETGYSFKYPNITSAAKEFSKLIYADEQYI
ncbi:epimerase family protein SDR39U1-like isoform X3 [Homarus americanus]|uniref:epimerase family protein SDR39U1-like isoform X3 n=1 Tax=Homarus americanus TaxID=6706 RepID=UPI001C488D0F|nr:epimerase family protein SDR39U1-like isoform X3 [Homarus americanus]